MWRAPWSPPGFTSGAGRYRRSSSGWLSLRTSRQNEPDDPYGAGEGRSTKIRAKSPGGADGPLIVQYTAEEPAARVPRERRVKEKTREETWLVRFKRLAERLAPT